MAGLSARSACDRVATQLSQAYNGRSYHPVDVVALAFNSVFGYGGLSACSRLDAKRYVYDTAVAFDQLNPAVYARP